ncbi:MAG: hypothetical protein NTV22_12400 [bacterium]|nr:hypothetical protein [bacterium]
MKNLLRFCRVPFGLLVLAQCLIGCMLSLLPHYNTTRNNLLFVVLPYAGMGATLWLTHRLVGLVGLRREQVTARFPGPRWQLEVLRVLLPLVCALLPPLFLVAWADCGAYWAVQRAWHGAPLLPYAARYTACMFLPCVLGTWTAMTIFLSGIALANSYARSNQIGWIGQFMLLAAGAVAFGASLLLFTLFNVYALDPQVISGLALWPLCVLVYALVLRPQRPASLRLGALLRYVIFVALCIMVVPGGASAASCGPWLCPAPNPWPHDAMTLRTASSALRRNGWLAALLALPCGLNLWWALGWLLCLPDSVMVLCAGCDARTHSWRARCPRCATPLRYSILTPLPRGLGRVRLSALMAGIVVLGVIRCLIPSVTVTYSTGDPLPHRIHLRCLAAYPMTNIVIALKKRVVGANHVTLAGSDFPQLRRLDWWSRPFGALEFFCNGMWLQSEISTTDRSGALDVFCYVRPPYVIDTARKVRKKLLLADAAWPRATHALVTTNETVLVELLVMYFNEANLHFNARVQTLFSNYWSALPAREQSARAAFYFTHWSAAVRKFSLGGSGSSGVRSDAVVPTAIMRAAPNNAFVTKCPSWNIFQQSWPAQMVQAALSPFAQNMVCGQTLGSSVPAAQHLTQWYLRQHPAEIAQALRSGMIVATRSVDYAAALPPLLPAYRRAAAQTSEHARDYADVFSAYCLVRGLSSAPLAADDEALLQKFSVATNRFSSWPLLVGLDSPIVWDVIQRQGWPGSIEQLYEFESVWPQQFVTTNIAACLRALAALTPKPADNAWLVAVLCHWPASDATLAALLQRRIESALDAALRCGGVNRDNVVRTLVQQACRQGDAKISAAAKKIYETPHGDAVACLDLLAAASSNTLHETIVRYRDELAALQDELR